MIGTWARAHDGLIFVIIFCTHRPVTRALKGNMRGGKEVTGPMSQDYQSWGRNRDGLIKEPWFRTIPSFSTPILGLITYISWDLGSGWKNPGSLSGGYRRAFVNFFVFPPASRREMKDSCHLPIPCLTARKEIALWDWRWRRFLESRGLYPSFHQCPRVRNLPALVSHYLLSLQVTASRILFPFNDAVIWKIMTRAGIHLPVTPIIMRKGVTVDPTSWYTVELSNL
jgi:hypothetical protein